MLEAAITVVIGEGNWYMKPPDSRGLLVELERGYITVKPDLFL